MTKIKFPKTRRDKFKEIKDLQEDAEVDAIARIYKPPKDKKKNGLLESDSDSRATPQSQQSQMSGPYGTGKLVQRRIFEAEPVVPLTEDQTDGAGDSSQYNPRMSAQSGAIITGGGPLDDDDDDVFEGPERGYHPYSKTASYVHQQHPGTEPYCPSYYANTSVYTDYTDKKPDPYEGAASFREILFCFWGLVTYLFDFGSDLWLAYLYFSYGNMWWFALTLVFVAVPAITMSIFSLILYIRDWKIMGDKATGTRWASRAVFLVLQMGPLLRIIDTVTYGCKSRNTRDFERRRDLYQRMLDEDTDSMLLRLFEAFMEAAPQLVLQLYIMTQIGTTAGTFLVVVQVFGLITSLVTLATVLVCFQKSLRLSYPNKAKLSFCGMMGQFLWRVCTITSRVFALALFASQFHFFVFVVVGIHWLCMLAWVVKQETGYCVLIGKDGRYHHSRPFEFCFRVLAAFIHIFCFFNLIEGHTRLRCLVYYAVMYFENVVMVVVWYVTATTQGENLWYYHPGLVVVLVIFWVGICFQVLYYVACHPNNSDVLHSRKSIRWWVPWAELSLATEDSSVSENRHSDVPYDEGLSCYIPTQSEAGTSLNSSMIQPHNTSRLHMEAVMHRLDAPHLRHTPSNASSSSSASLLPRPPSRPYTPQKSAGKQVFVPTLAPQREVTTTDQPETEVKKPVPAPRIKKPSASTSPSSTQTTV